MSATKYGLSMFMSLACSSLVFAQSDGSPTEVAASLVDAEKPYEVVITGRVTRAHLRDLIVEVEDDFFDKFNELNTDDAYDMYCYKYTPIMSHIRKRVCEPLFLIKYRSQQSSDALGLMIGGAAIGPRLAGIYLESPEEMVQNKERYYKILVEKLEAFTASDTELAEIASVMEQLKYRLENY